MKIYHYDDKYAKKNGVNGVFELIATVCVGIAGILTPVILLGLGEIPVKLAVLIFAFTILVCCFLMRRVRVIVASSMSAILDSGGVLYYLMITPNLRGSSLPHSMTAMLAGPSATYAENSINAGIAATNLAQNDDIVLSLFKLYQEDKIKTTFDTVMYGKPVRVCELLDRDFQFQHKKIFRVKCIKDKKRHATVSIPRVFPAFFEQEQTRR